MQNFFAKKEWIAVHYCPNKLILLPVIFLMLLPFFAVAQNYTVNSNADTHATNFVTGTDAGGNITLRSALEAANTQPGAHIISFSGTVVSPVSLTLGQIPVGNAANGNNITIAGPGMNVLTINQTTDNRVFSTGAGAITFQLKDIKLNFAGPGIASYSGGGGAIIAGGAGASTTLINVAISNFNRQVGNGGALSQSSANANHTLTVTNCIFTNNKCGGNGGAVSYIGLGIATITGCTFSGNQTGPVGTGTGGDGGALSTSGGGSGGTYIVEKNTFLNNQVLNSTGHAGAVINTNGTLTLRYNRFIGNSCANTLNPPLANVVAQTGGLSVNTTTANNNWWGVNTGPGPNDATVLGAGGTLTLTKWLQLKTTASTNPICNNVFSGPGNTSNITAGFLSNSANEAIDASNLSALTGLPVTWSQTLGSLSGQEGTIQASGTATALFTSNGTGGIATVNAQVDNIPASETSPARASITVNTTSTAPTGINGVTAICSGGNTMLTVTGGSKGSGAITEWFTGACGETTAGTGDVITVSPLLTTTYFVRYNGVCNTTACVSVTVTVNQPVDAGTDGSIDICDNSSTAIDLYSLITGEQTGGNWSRSSGTGGTFNAGSGIFTPAAGATTSVFKYLLTGTAPCPDDESLATVNITAQANAGADGSMDVCDNSSTAINLYSLITGEQTGGTWSRLSGTGGMFNAGSGIYTPAPGATTSTFKYLVTGTVPCPDDESTATVNITAQVNAGADGSTNICDNSSNTIDLYSLISGEQSGGTWSRISGTGGAFNAGAGTFTPSPGATTSGFQYLLNGTEPCPDDESFATVNISAQSYAGTDGSTDVCGDANMAVNLYSLISGEQAGGVWTRLTGTGGTFNAAAGTFITSAGGTTTSTFKYFIAGTYPCPDDESVATVNIIVCCTAVNSGTVANGNETICYGGNPSNITFSTLPSGGSVTGSFNYQWYYKDGVSGPCPAGTNTSGWILISGATGSSYDPPGGLTVSRTYAVTTDPTGITDCGPETWAGNCRKVTVSPALFATCSNNNPVLYFGYTNDQTATVKAIATGGTAPYTITITMNRALNCNVLTSSGDELWAGVGGTSVNNVCPATGSGLLPPVSTGTVAASGGFYSLNVTLMQDAVFTATITDANGCVSTCTTFIHAVDVRCFAGNSGNAKVKLCHATGNGCHAICVSESAVASHLAHGDYLGDCTPNCTAPQQNLAATTEKTSIPAAAGQSNTIPQEKIATVLPVGLFRVKVTPNPSGERFTLIVESGSSEKIFVVVYDVLGKIAAQMEISNGKPIHFGEEMKKGYYIAVVRQGEKTTTIKLVKQ